ncbi:MAG: caspase family protein [Cyanobacteriota bacterium]|jgi:hypothetical protein
MKRLLQTTALACSLLASGHAYSEVYKALPIPSEARTGTIYASQSGRATLDRGEDGGNPFASALVELLNRSSLSLAELVSQITTITQQKSGGYQLPDISGIRGANNWAIKPTRSDTKNVALVATFSQYTAENVSHLPGAERDRVRVTNALRAAGFKVVTIANPTKSDLGRLLYDLSKASKDSDVAFIYVTGHGFEDQKKVYLAPSGYHFKHRDKSGRDSAIYVGSLVNGLKAKHANLVFFGGCRTILR